jgi:hypothetical protein
MSANRTYKNSNGMGGFSMPTIPRQAIVGIIFLVALIAFETFNFDTTEFALETLLGETSFLSLRWATILAVAFCAIDFAGLSRIFTEEKGADEPKEVWYLTGAWLLGATMNAVMTWWAVSVTLLGRDFGNEVLSREQLLRIVPIFVAVLVWLTRILFIGSLAIAGDHLFDFGRKSTQTVPVQKAPKRTQQKATSSRGRSPALKPSTAQSYSTASQAPQQNAARNGRGKPTPIRRRQAPASMQGQNSRSRSIDF